jgi:hypothetical protein
VGTSEPPGLTQNLVENIRDFGRKPDDDEIVRLVRTDHRPQQISVVTSDSTLLADRLRDAAASAYPAANFATSLTRFADPLLRYAVTNSAMLNW